MSNAPYIETFRARWADMDFNQHMRNAAFLGCSEETRMGYLAQNGWTMDELARRKLGPVVVEDRLVYRRELRLLDPFRVELRMGAVSADARKMRLHNTFVREDGAVAAEVSSVVLWFDLAARKPVAPPDELRDLWLALARSGDFEAW